MTDRFQSLKGDLILLSAAIIWGIAFIAQKQAMQSIGSFSFTGFRFLLGGFILLGILLPKIAKKSSLAPKNTPKWRLTLEIVLLSVFLFFGSNLQQFGLVTSTPTNTAVITSLYILLVPFLLLFTGAPQPRAIWLAGIVAFFGVYLLVTPDLKLRLDRLNVGDIYAFFCAFFWAAHIIMMERVLRRGVNPILVAVSQSLLAGALSMIPAFLLETPTFSDISDLLPELAVAGALSIAVGYTLQIVGQKYSPPSHAAIILGSEAFFASLADYLYFDNLLSLTAYLGGILTVGAGISIQVIPLISRKKKRSN